MAGKSSIAVGPHGTTRVGERSIRLSSGQRQRLDTHNQRLWPEVIEPFGR